MCRHFVIIRFTCKSNMFDTTALPHFRSTHLCLQSERLVIHICMHICMHMHIHVHTHSHCRYTYAHAHACTHARTQAHTHTYTRTHYIYAYTHANARTHTHTFSKFTLASLHYPLFRNGWDWINVILLFAATLQVRSHPWTDPRADRDAVRGNRQREAHLHIHHQLRHRRNS